MIIIYMYIIYIIDTGLLKGQHPVHLHGHSFHVMKIGYPEYAANADVVRVNQDILCSDQNCLSATWRDPSWLGGNVPGLNHINPPVKDVVSVPWGGYVVIRFIADNPGDCFTENHVVIWR